MSYRARRLTAEVPITGFAWGGTNPPPLVERQAQAPEEPNGGARNAARLAALEREAFAKGYEQGERSGIEAAGQRGEAMLRRLTETLNELTGLRTQMIRQTERQMVELSLAVARRIVHREITLDQDLLIAIARVALDRLGESAQVTVRLNPEEYEVTGAARARELGQGSVSVVADGRVPRGGCRIDSAMGMLDAGVDAQIQEIARALLGDAEAVTSGVAIG